MFRNTLLRMSWDWTPEGPLFDGDACIPEFFRELDFATPLAYLKVCPDTNLGRLLPRARKRHPEITQYQIPVVSYANTARLRR